MKINNLVKYRIFVVIFSMSITSCCEKYFNDNTDLKSSSPNPICLENKNFFDSKKISKKVQELQNINIIYFDFNQYNILPQFIHMLNKHSDFLRQHQDYKIIIEGHADERGTPEYNIALGERRANSVKIYLQSQGVTENQISILSYGKEKPDFLGHSEEEYAKNRRAVLVY